MVLHNDEPLLQPALDLILRQVQGYKQGYLDAVATAQAQELAGEEGHQGQGQAQAGV